MSVTVLVTGGLGFIGSHTVVELTNEGYEVIIADNLSNADRLVLKQIEKISGKQPVFYEVDLCVYSYVQEIFSKHTIDLVIHFAAFKSVSESVKQPLLYFYNNLLSLLNVLRAMQEYRVRNIIFSSSATVYGEPDTLPVTESSPFKKALSAYGSSKQMGEEIMEKAAEGGVVNSISLRYFNPVGAHASGLIGERPIGVPNNLFPYIMQGGTGKLKQLTVFGNDYPTPDGSCIRDYIHVVDLAIAHVQASKRLIEGQQAAAFEVFNIGTGKGYSVLEVIAVFEKVTGRKLNYVIGQRREGDAAEIYADAGRAREVLGWKAVLGMEEMIASAWKWESGLVD